MGVHPNVGFDRFPEQSIHKDLPVEVIFGYDTSKRLRGVIVRDDRQEPFETIIKLEDGRYVRAEECQYSIKVPEGGAV